jgi:alanine racemase
VAARAVCPNARILVIGGIFSGQGPDVVRHKLTALAWEPDHLDELESAARAADLRSLSIQVEIDTGMTRQGVDPERINQILGRFNRNSPLRVEGLMTHLFAADEADGRVTESQLTRMDEVLGRVQAAGIHAGWLNVGNSAALLAGQASVIAGLAARYQMKAIMRPGLALYGLVPPYDPQFEPEEPSTLREARGALRPALSWKSEVVSVRAVPAGTVVGYNGTFVAAEPMRLALIAAGYADGLDRRLGNRFSLLVRGERAPLVGRISMDQAVIDVTEINNVSAGDEVVLLGRQGQETISAFDHAEATETIPWEVFTRIGSRVRRIEV